MLKVLILYFSGTGNTWWIAKELQKSLEEKGAFVENCSIESYSYDELKSKIDNAEHVVMGFPVYGSKAPYPFDEFVSSLDDYLGNKSLSIYATQALASGDTALHMATLIISKGFTLKNTFHFNMSNSFHIPQFKFFKPKDAESAEKTNLRCLPKVNMLANKIVDNRIFIRGNTPVARLIGDIQRRHIDKVIKNASATLYSDKKTCINCNKCVEMCPTQNITMENESYVFGNKCTLCMRCYSYCPTNSINFGVGSLDINRYPRYKGPEKGFNVDMINIKPKVE